MTAENELITQARRLAQGDIVLIKNKMAKNPSRSPIHLSIETRLRDISRDSCNRAAHRIDVWQPRGRVWLYSLDQSSREQLCGSNG